ncbi:hypothetical protein [Lentzea sp. CA-135723]|uniref:hypothetical protein n=1 Tax=Lentzea sp. CA-135723 TaxID=3239950 RepID=UPI003D8DD928
MRDVVSRIAAAAGLGLTVWLSPTYAGYVLLLATAAAALYEHRHRFRRDQANG